MPVSSESKSPVNLTGLFMSDGISMFIINMIVISCASTYECSPVCFKHRLVRE